MLHLTLVGLSEDKRRLLLVSDSGDQFSLTIDGKLRAALRGEHGRLGQLEIHMESALRPRDIQARIRAGETPEAVAQAAQTTVDKILPYANPVLAERAHVAQRAQRSSLRRTGEAPGGARTLGDAVAAQLRSHNVDPETVEWDAWRREDGRWSMVGDFAAPERRGTAKFTFDAPGNYVTLDNDEAKWLVGEQVSRQPAPKDDLQQARQRRLRAAGSPEDELPLGDDALDLVKEQSDADLSPTPEPLADEPAVHRPEPAATTEPETSPAAEADVEVAEVGEQRSPQRPTKRKGRASVPSWDEIMFGGGRHD